MQAWVVAGDQTQIVRHALSTRCQAVRTDAEWVNDTRTHLRVALDAASAEPPTDATALERWKNVGFVPDKPVGEERSHTLISALWNSLRACGVLPRNQGQRTVEAENIMRQCRAALVGQNVCNTLNWHRDGRAVVSWLLRHAGVQPKQNLQLQCADRHKLEEIAPSISSLDVHRVGPTASEATTLRIYAYSTVTGKEWWYEALNPQQDESLPPVAAGISTSGHEAPAHAGNEGLPSAAAASKTPVRETAAMSGRLQPSAWVASGEHQQPENSDATMGRSCAAATSKTGQDVGHAPHLGEWRTGGDAALKTCLQNFLGARRSQAPICVCDADVASLRAKWQNLAAVGALLQTLLGASVPALEPTRQSARILAKAWMRYYVACTQGPPRTLSDPPTEDGNGQDGTNSAKIPSRTAAATAPGDAATTEAAGLRERQRSPPRKRYRTKAPQEEAQPSGTEQALEEDEYWLGTWKREHGNPDPRAKKDAAIKDLANLLRPQPLWPMGVEATDPAVDLPTLHCAFQECSYETETFDALQEHILCKHVKALRKVTDLQQPPLAWEAAGMEAYRAALTAACQAGAPTAHSAVDRRCLRQFQAAKDDDAVGAAICFFCASFRMWKRVPAGCKTI